MSSLFLDILYGVRVYEWVKASNCWHFHTDMSGIQIIDLIRNSKRAQTFRSTRLFIVWHNGHCFNRINHLSISLYAIQNTICFDGCCCIEIVVQFEPIPNSLLAMDVSASMGIVLVILGMQTAENSQFIFMSKNVFWPVNITRIQCNWNHYNQFWRSRLRPPREFVSYFREYYVVDVTDIL